MAAKKRKKAKKVEWYEAWCREHVEELVRHRGLCLTLHPKRGVVCIARDVASALVQEDCLRRSIAAECMHIDVEAMLVKIKWRDPLMSQAPFDVEAEREAMRRETAEEDAKPRRGSGAKAKKVPAPWVEELKDPPPDPQNGLPDLSPLAPPIDLFDNEAIIDVAGGPAMRPNVDDEWPVIDGLSMKPSGSFKSPFPSPHAQPPFSPRNGGFDRGILIDGAGRSMRGPRYD